MNSPLPMLMFIRTRIVMDSIPDDKLPIDEEAAGQRGMVAANSIVFPLMAGAPLPPIALDYVECAEVISVLPDVSADPELSQPGFYVSEPDELPDSYYMAMCLNAPYNYSSTEPAFGRKMLIVNYDEEPKDAVITARSSAIRRALGRNVPVWHGRRFEAYCFVDSRSVQLVDDALARLLNVPEVCDYLIVQPVAMVHKDPSGLSPLGDWLAEGWHTNTKW